MDYQKLYETTAKRFSKRILEELNGEIDSVVLYGSVARKRSTRDSDIDILVIGKKRGIEKRVFNTSHEIDYDNNFETFLVPVFLTLREVRRDVRSGSYFIKDILTQGVILYDDGTFRRIRKEALGAGK